MPLPAISLHKELQLYSVDVYKRQTLYIQEDVGYFYYLDTDVFEAVMPRLAECSLDITSFSDTNIKGTVNITGENNLMFTSIPYDSGWVVKLDGKRVETDKTLNALLAFEISSGEMCIRDRSYVSIKIKGLTHGNVCAFRCV